MICEMLEVGKKGRPMRQERCKGRRGVISLKENESGTLAVTLSEAELGWGWRCSE